MTSHKIGLDSPWVDVYRPTLLEGVVGQKEIVRAIRKFIQLGDAPHLLFYGPPGCGKTTTANCILNELYEGCSLASMVLNASNERGIETVRVKIKSFAISDASSFLPPNKRDYPKTVVLDEFDSMTSSAQNSMRQLMENCHRTRFILICNDLEKIDPAVQSRCAAMRFSRITEKEAWETVQYVAANENMDIDTECIQTVVDISKGDMRTIINTLQQISRLEGEVTSHRICTVSGHVSLLYWRELYGIYCSKKSLEKKVRKALKLVTEKAVLLGHTIPHMVREVMNSERSAEKKVEIVYYLARIEKDLATQIPDMVGVMSLCALLTEQ